MQINQTVIAEARAQALRTAQVIFAAMAIVALSVSLAFHFGLVGSELDAGDTALIARAFLLVGVLDTAMMFVWEQLSGAAD